MNGALSFDTDYTLRTFCMKKSIPPLDIKKKSANALICFGFLLILAFYIGYKVGKNAGERERSIESIK